MQLVEVRGDRDDRLPALHSEGRLGHFADVTQNESADLAERISLTARGHQDAAARPLRELERESLAGLLHLVAAVGTADQALDRVDGVLRIEEPALFGGSSDEHIAARMKRNDRGDERPVLAG